MILIFLCIILLEGIGMEKKKSNIIKNWKLWVGVIAILLLIIIASIFILRNKMTAEETVSNFMHLIESKEYEEAKKLSNGKLEKLEILSNIKPSSLNFDFTEDKKRATAVLLEEEIESTNLNIVMNNTLLGWKIKSYDVVTDLIDPQIIEDRLKKGKIVSDIQLLYWGESEIASKDEISEYGKNNGMVAMIFAETMKSKNYEKANKMYQPIVETHLNIEQLKKYDWDNYEIIGDFLIMEGPGGNLDGINIRVKDKKLYIMVAGKTIMSVTEAKS